MSLTERWLPRLLGLLLACMGASTASAEIVYVVSVDGQITGGTTAFLEGALERAEAEETELFVIELDTPGGAVDATKDIVSLILNARVPVAVFVSPRGAWAASAGTFITMAGHVAAMAPGTTIGAAHPVGAQGEDPGGPLPPEPKEGEDAPQYRQNFIGQKLENIITAFAQSIADERGRNVEFAAQAVRESIALTGTEAVEKNVVDLVAQDLDDLLERIDGREVKVGKETRTLSTRGARVVRIEMDWQEQLLAFLANPVVALALLSLGMLGLYVEFTNPGAILPGVGGAVCLVLAAFAFQIVPFEPVGVLLIVFGIVLMAAEAFVPAFGLLFVAGAVCVLGGGYLVFDVPGLEGLAPAFFTTLLPVLAMLVAGMGVVVFLVSRSLFRPSFAGSGADGLVGQIATVDSPISPRGRVRLQGELWNAEAAEPLEPGERVRIDEVHDLVVRVSRIPHEEET